MTAVRAFSYLLFRSFSFCFSRFLAPEYDVDDDSLRCIYILYTFKLYLYYIFLSVSALRNPGGKRTKNGVDAIGWGDSLERGRQ